MKRVVLISKLRLGPETDHPKQDDLSKVYLNKFNMSQCCPTSTCCDADLWLQIFLTENHDVWDLHFQTAHLFPMMDHEHIHYSEVRIKLLFTSVYEDKSPF